MVSVIAMVIVIPTTIVTAIIIVVAVTIATLFATSIATIIMFLALVVCVALAHIFNVTTVTASMIRLSSTHLRLQLVTSPSSSLQQSASLLLSH